MKEKKYVEMIPDVTSVEHTHIVYNEGFYNKDELKAIVTVLFTKALDALYASENVSHGTKVNIPAIESYLEKEFTLTRGCTNLQKKDYDRHTFTTKAFKNTGNVLEDVFTRVNVNDQVRDFLSMYKDFYIQVYVQSTYRDPDREEKKKRTNRAIKVFDSGYLKIKDFMIDPINIRMERIEVK